MILTDREIKIYIQRKLIEVDPEPEDIAYQSTAVDLRLDPTISVFTKPPAVGGIQRITRIDPGDPNFKTEEAIRALTKNEEIDPTNGYPLEPGITDAGLDKGISRSQGVEISRKGRREELAGAARTINSFNGADDPRRFPRQDQT